MMAKVELKTKKNDASVKEFLGSIEDQQRRKDCQEVAKMMRKATGKTAKMWGTSIVGFGDYGYKYASGREGNWMRIGFSPRKQSLTLYIMNGFGKYDELMQKLGKHKTGTSCLYINRLSDIDIEILNKLIVESIGYMNEKFGKN